MGIFSIFKKSITRRYPVFGTMTLERKGVWEGRITIPGLGTNLTAVVWAGEEGPSAWQQMLAEDFVTNFNSMLEEYKFELFSRYCDMQRARSDDPDFPQLEDEEELWQAIKCEIVVFEPEKSTYPGLAVTVQFNNPWDCEHGLELLVTRDGDLLEVRVE